MKIRTIENGGDDSSVVLLYGRHLSDTIISKNTYLSGNIIMESRYLVPSYVNIGLHTGNEKYRI